MTRPAIGPRPLIGLSGRRKKGGDLVGNFETLSDLDIDLYYSDYARAILEAGGMPMHLPIDVDPTEVVDHLDAVLLTGGTDIGPERYGQQPIEDLHEPEPERDTFELALCDAAAARSMPTLGICRGLQLINVHAGGTLHQDVPVHAAFDHSPDTHSHSVTLTEGSSLAGLYGSTRSVNSLHHQTVDELGQDLVATAMAEDGTVEGIEHRSLPIVAVQWHPEMMATRSSDPVFGWLVDAATAHSTKQPISS